ncbi:UNVERIFIED_CONTAM: hypothetical protein PYX00_007073 [Menopon gallinae]|uniref:Thioredoxin domain-containing protein n=1 Tax=Menopon gallinae TaxID=328185 RepID=A0AAW2HHV1_9NEOP
MSFVNGLRQLCHPYYIINIILSVSYITAKKLPYLCQYVPINPESVCELDSRESEILFFLIIVVMLRTRKAGSVTMISYLSSSFMYSKVANMILWFYGDIRLGLVYCVAFVLTGLFFPEPTYSGPQKIMYFKSLSSFEEEMERDRNISWIIAFYTMWNPACNNLAPVFAQLSAEYHTQNLRFGKVDLGRSPEAGKKYHINDAPTSKQLPTVILFQNCKEVCRRPTADSTGRLQKFFFSEDNIRTTFDLNNLYEQSKSRQKTGKAEAANAKKEQ